MISAEKHYQPTELGQLWGFSPKTIRSLFSEEPGVLRVGSSKYVSLRIPASVAARVHERLAQPPTRVRVARKVEAKPANFKRLLAEMGRK